MGSFSTCETCPRCGQMSYLIETNYKTGESFLSCFECGILHEKYIKTDKNGKYLDKEGNVITSLKEGQKLYDVADFDWYHISDPYGILKISLDSGITNTYCMQTEKDAVNFFDFVSLEENQGKVVTKVVLQYFVDGELKKKQLFPEC